MATKTRDKHLLTRGVQPVLLGAQEFLTFSEIAAILKVSRRTLARLRARGDLPAPVQLATNILRWRAEDVRAFLNNLKTRKKPRQRA